MTKAMSKRFSVCEQEQIEVFPILVSLILNQGYEVEKWKKDVFYDL